MLASLQRLLGEDRHAVAASLHATILLSGRPPEALLRSLLTECSGGETQGAATSRAQHQALRATCALAAAELLLLAGEAASQAACSAFVSDLLLPSLRDKAPPQALLNSAAAALEHATAWPATTLLLTSCRVCLQTGEQDESGELSLPTACEAGAAVATALTPRLAAKDGGASELAATQLLPLLAAALESLGAAPASDGHLLRALLPALIAALDQAALDGSGIASAAALQLLAQAGLRRRAGLALLLRCPFLAPALSERHADAEAAWMALRSSLWAPNDAGSRKAARHVLRCALERQLPVQPAWLALLSLLEACEDYPIHLLTPALARVSATAPLPPCWAALPWCRGVTHENPLMRTAAYAALAERATALPCPEEALLGPLLQGLCDAATSGDPRGVAAAAAAAVAAQPAYALRHALARRALGAAAGLAVPGRTARAMLAVVSAACGAVGCIGSEPLVTMDADTALESLRRLAVAASSDIGATAMPYEQLMAAAAAMAPPPALSAASAARLLLACGPGSPAAARHWLAGSPEGRSWLVAELHTGIAFFLGSGENGPPGAAEVAHWRALAAQLASLTAALPDDDLELIDGATCEPGRSVFAPLDEAARRADALYSLPGRAERAALLLEALGSFENAGLRILVASTLGNAAASLCMSAVGQLAVALVPPSQSAPLADPAPSVGGGSYGGGPPLCLSQLRMSRFTSVLVLLAPMALRPDAAISPSAARPLWKMLGTIINAAKSPWWIEADAQPRSATALSELRLNALHVAAAAAAAIRSLAPTDDEEMATRHEAAGQLFEVVCSSAVASGARHSGAWAAVCTVMQLPGAVVPNVTLAAALGAAIAACSTCSSADAAATMQAVRSLLAPVLAAPPQVRDGLLSYAATAVCEAVGDCTLSDPSADKDMPGGAAFLSFEQLPECSSSSTAVTQLACALCRCMWAGFAQSEKWSPEALAELVAAALHLQLFSLPELHGPHGCMRRLLQRLLHAASKSSRLLAAMAPWVWALWTSHPEIAALHAPEMLYSTLLGAERESALGLTDLPSGDVSPTQSAAQVFALSGAHALATAGNGNSPVAALSLLRHVLRSFTEGEASDLAALTYRRCSPTHVRKLRAWQLAASLAPALSVDGAAVPLASLLFAALDAPALACVRQYAEALVAHAVINSPALLCSHLLPCERSGLSPPAVSSRLLVAHAVARHAARDAEQAAAVRATLAEAVPLATSHHHATRTLALLVLHDLYTAFPAEHALWGAQPPHRDGGPMQALAHHIASLGLDDGRVLESRSPAEACLPAALLCLGPGVDGAALALTERLAAMLADMRQELRDSRTAAEATALAPERGGGVAKTELAALQRKATPAAALAAALRSMPAVDQGVAAVPAPRRQLELVASLVDNAANVGGLARTAEVLSLRRLVVSDESVVATPLFKQLASTAEKWLPIAAVSPAALPAYLAARRAEGFTLLALEQAAGSVSLPSYQWPAKAVLLLGAEGTGVPPALLPLLDVCLEIPQRGCVRSLNVAVAGALAAYAYSCQHE